MYLLISLHSVLPSSICHVSHLSFQFLCKTEHNTSTPLIPTGAYPHIPIPSRLHSSGGKPDAASSPATSLHLAYNCPIHYQHFHFLALGLTPWPKFTKVGDDLLYTQVYHPAEFNRPASTHARDIHHKKICKQRNSKWYTCIPACLLACWNNNKT